MSSTQEEKGAMKKLWKISSHSDQNTMWKRPVHKKYIPETVPACPTTEKVVVDGYRRIKRDRYNIIITQDRDTLLEANHCECILKQMGKVWWKEWRGRDRNSHSVPSILVKLICQFSKMLEIANTNNSVSREVRVSVTVGLWLGSNLTN